MNIKKLLNDAKLNFNEGDIQSAEKKLKKILSSSSSHVDANLLLGLVFHQKGDFKSSIKMLEKVVEIKRNHAEAYSNLGAVLEKISEFDKAILNYKLAIKHKADFLNAYVNLGLLLKRLNRCEEANNYFNAAIQLNPAIATTHYNLGASFDKMGKVEESLRCFEEALRLNPDYDAAMMGLARAMWGLEKYELAEKYYKNLLAKNSNYFDVHYNLAVTLVEQDKIEEALLHYKKTLALNPNHLLARNNLLLAMNFTSHVSNENMLIEAKAYGGMVHSNELRVFANKPEPEKNLKIGLVSGDFSEHSVAFFLKDILAEFNSKAASFFIYNASKKEDQMTRHFKSIVNTWSDVVDLDDDSLVDLIISHNIDVLVDLSGHTKNNRLPVFARKPAPVQVTWLGYSATTGVDAIDYVISDKWVIPQGEERNFVEKAWRLPDAYLCFSQPDESIKVGKLPALSNDYITFGSFNNLSKTNDTVIKCWSEILKSIPGSRLYLKNKKLLKGNAREKIIKNFSKYGVPSEQLILQGITPTRDQHLKTYHNIDIALDTFPYAGTTTTAEALWMGVPVVSLRGDSFISNVGESVLENTGLSEWLANDVDDYIKKAISFSSDLTYLTNLKSKLRNQLVDSPLCDTKQFVTNLDEAFRDMWKIWCAKQRIE
jgi:protein O-GlcNAc transferase